MTDYFFFCRVTVKIGGDMTFIAKKKKKKKKQLSMFNFHHSHLLTILTILVCKQLSTFNPHNPIFPSLRSHPLSIPKSK